MLRRAGGELHARGINLHIRTGICAGLHRPNAQSVADTILFLVAAMSTYSSTR